MHTCLKVLLKHCNWVEVWSSTWSLQNFDSFHFFQQFCCRFAAMLGIIVLLHKQFKAIVTFVSRIRLYTEEFTVDSETAETTTLEMFDADQTSPLWTYLAKGCYVRSLVVHSDATFQTQDILLCSFLEKRLLAACPNKPYILNAIFCSLPGVVFKSF